MLSDEMDVREDLACRKGLVTKMSFFCTLCKKEDVFSDPHSSNEETRSINTKSDLAARMVGMRMEGLSCFMGIMGIPQLLYLRLFNNKR